MTGPAFVELTFKEITMLKKYIVNTPIKVPGETDGTFGTITSGKPIILSDEDAAPLLACQAIREPDVIADDGDTDTKPAKKK